MRVRGNSVARSLIHQIPSRSSRNGSISRTSGLVFSEQFARIIETVCPAANLISLVAADDCGQSLCTDTRVPGHNHPDWLRALRANSTNVFHVIAIITGWSVFLNPKT